MNDNIQNIQSGYNLRILIIDDNPEIHNDFKKILTIDPTDNALDSLSEKLFRKKNRGQASHNTNLIPFFEIDSALQGNLGIDQVKIALAEKRPYSLIFVDIRMPPGLDGVQTIKKIWELDPDVQIVISSAYSDYTWEETISELGIKDNLLIIKKPFDNAAVRQIACALTKKWILLNNNKQHKLLLEKTVQERTSMLQQSLAELEYNATHDTLTGLPNRVLLNDRINQAIKTSERNKTITGVLFFDIDAFKFINDNLSHEVGDQLLQEVAKRMSSLIRSADTLARFGGDEFILVMPDIRKEDDILIIADKLLTAVNMPTEISNNKFSISISIGISFFPKDGTTPSELLRNADLAMYCAKSNGGNRFQFFTDELNIKSASRFKNAEELKNAIKNKEFVLHYQPQLDIKTGTLTAVEALIRWHHPTQGIIQPDGFIPLAEDTGLIISIGEWVIRTACEQNKKWQDLGFPKFRVAVNVSTKQLYDKNFMSVIISTLHDTKLDPKYMEIELTENIMLDNTNILSVVNELIDMGIYVAFDDFGTGNTGLNNLKRTHVNQLKIDQSFVRNINQNKSDEVIIQAIISIAKDLSLGVIAEGVETYEQLKFLIDHHCDEAQGHYFNKAMSSSDMDIYLNDYMGNKRASLG